MTKPCAYSVQLVVRKTFIESDRLPISNPVKVPTILAGGRDLPDLKGAYYEPTLITRVKPSMRVWKEEVFEPVLPVVSYKKEDEAITLANDTIYTAVIFTPPAGRGRKDSHR